MAATVPARSDSRLPVDQTLSRFGRMPRVAPGCGHRRPLVLTVGEPLDKTSFKPFTETLH
jgi:hypothetical protein